jgi:hypothetical protein
VWRKTAGCIAQDFVEILWLRVHTSLPIIYCKAWVDFQLYLAFLILVLLTRMTLQLAQFLSAM